MTSGIDHHISVIGQPAVHHHRAPIFRRHSCTDVELRPERRRRDHRQQRAQRNLQDAH